MHACVAVLVEPLYVQSAEMRVSNNTAQTLSKGWFGFVINWHMLAAASMESNTFCTSGFVAECLLRLHMLASRQQSRSYGQAE